MFGGGGHASSETKHRVRVNSVRRGGVQEWYIVGVVVVTVVMWCLFDKLADIFGNMGTRIMKRTALIRLVHQCIALGPYCPTQAVADMPRVDFCFI